LIPRDIGREAVLSNDTRGPKELKITDKRIFTADGEIKEEFKSEIHAVSPSAPVSAADAQGQQSAPASSNASSAESAAPSQPPAAAGNDASGEQPSDAPREGAGENPATPFAHFLESLIMQAYMSLGMLRDPYSPQQPKTNPAAARQMIDILTMLGEKTRGNLTPAEAEFLQVHLGELKLAYVQRTKSI
jgi:hypothetical protein